MSDFSRAESHDGEAGEGTKAWDFTSPVRLDQLDYEVTSAMNWRNSASLSASGDLENVGPDSPLTVLVGRADIDESAFEAAASEHEPDPNWFPAPASDAPTPPTVEDISVKAEAGAPLTDEELQIAVRHLLAQDQAG